ncbi:MAG: peptide chain release factor N(5)-glutamine methyltransferase [Treponema sp.]|uniref:peptide chain release factor N(5)-glutamine methyltransferase n=1 Tax=Treponema sp. TaxID=166 RepID=UPI0025E84043|nr:peptide chain release factor N(5)-glutamine methyltransferase [Treponema sp.]MBQ8678362.1 peptide chain release factor N(5)-glutamine methyltransferase [Treponema sp.]
MTIQEAKLYGKINLPDSPTPELDTAVLLQHITSFDKTHLLLNRDFELTGEQEADFLAAIEKRKTGFPVAYITGHKEFFGLDFLVTPDVLIPKPDTELLVELALDALEDKFRANPASIPTVCDMCTGSGCVGISINAELRMQNAELKMTFVDISEKALEVAKKNAQRLLGMGKPSDQCPVPHYELSIMNCAFVQSNLFENIPHTFDLIVTNPPYVPHSESLELLKDGRSEPLLALDGDVTENGEYARTEDGLSLIRRLLPQCYEHLNRNGVLIMETGEYNAQETAELFRLAGFRNVRIEYDMNEMMRDVVGVK